MNLHYFQVALVLHLLAFVNVAHAQMSKSPQELEEYLRAFEIELDALRKENHMPGLPVAIVKDHQVLWSQGFGYADKDRSVPVTPDTPFWIASVTKTFVGLAFLHLEAEGSIDLDERAADTPNFDRLCRWLAGSPLPFGRDLHCDAPITIRHILHHQVQGEPGSVFFYNPIMYSRLSRYLEHKFGEGVDAVEGRHNMLGQTIDRTILSPAGMTRTMSSQWDRSKPLVFFDMAQGFGIGERGEWIARPRPGRHLPGGAGVVSTVLDLAKYDIAIDEGVIAPPAIKQKLFSPARLNDGTPGPYAFGWYVQEHQGNKLLWHAGWDDEHGFSALFLKIPNRNLTLILLANGEGLWWGNPLDKATVGNAPFARAFLDRFVLNMGEDR